MTKIGGMPSALHRLLTSPTHLKIGQSLDNEDAARLKQEFNLQINNASDLADVARLMGFKKRGLKALTEVLLGKFHYYYFFFGSSMIMLTCCNRCPLG
jgi:hypothetical protein